MGIESSIKQRIIVRKESKTSRENKKKQIQIIVIKYDDSILCVYKNDDNEKSWILFLLLF
jgi:hypothetical protein